MKATVTHQQVSSQRQAYGRVLQIGNPLLNW
ncbi:hypothetical protein VRRI112168_10945 [Vreelandella rituensis]